MQPLLQTSNTVCYEVLKTSTHTQWTESRCTRQFICYIGENLMLIHAITSPYACIKSGAHFLIHTYPRKYIHVSSNNVKSLLRT